MIPPRKGDRGKSRIVCAFHFLSGTAAVAGQAKKEKQKMHPCGTCKKWGHYAPTCPKKRNPRPVKEGQGKKKRTKLDNDDAAAQTDEELEIEPERPDGPPDRSSSDPSLKKVCELVAIAKMLWKDATDEDRTKVEEALGDFCNKNAYTWCAKQARAHHA